MRRKLPSTAALAAFEAAARHQSFTKAAAELAVTQSAVCRQIASLEGFLGVALFRRGQRGVGLTEAGLRYSRSVATRLDEVERDTLDLMAEAGTVAAGDLGGSLELAVVPTFATQWLLPRLPDFQGRHPGVTLHFTPRTRPFLFGADEPFHAAIHAGVAAWPGTEGRFLMRESLVAVASPAVRAKHEHWRLADLAGETLLQASTRPYAWRHWLESAGTSLPNDMAGPRMELFSMLAAAAAHGLGVALVPRLLVEGELADGRLCQLLPHEAFSDRAYYLITPEGSAEPPALTAFAGWLEGQAAPYRRAAGLE